MKQDGGLALETDGMDDAEGPPECLPGSLSTTSPWTSSVQRESLECPASQSCRAHKGEEQKAMLTRASTAKAQRSMSGVPQMRKGFGTPLYRERSPLDPN